MKNFYQILGVSINATNDEIKTAYRKLATKFHPDKNDGDNYFEERFKEIQLAYETLKDNYSRNEYDTKLRNYQEGRKSEQSENPTSSKTSSNSQYYQNENKTPKNNTNNKPNNTQINSKSNFGCGTIIIFLISFLAFWFLLKQCEKKTIYENNNLDDTKSTVSEVIDSAENISQNITSKNEVYKNQTIKESIDFEIENIVNNYYNTISNKNFTEFYNIFSPNVNFFGKPNFSVDEIIIENKEYQNRWPFYEINLDSDSFEIDLTDTDNKIVNYRIFYKVKRKQEDKWKIFNLKMKMVLDQNMQIKSINETQE